MTEEALMNQAKRYAKAHIDACETWEHGDNGCCRKCMRTLQRRDLVPLLRRTGRNCLVVKKERLHEPASSGALVNIQFNFSRKEKEWKVLKSTNLKSKM